MAKRDPGQGPAAGDLVVSALALARRACRQVGLSIDGLESLRVHSNAVFLAVESGIVLRIGDGADALGRARRAVAVTRWLAQRGFPAVVPAQLEQPVILADAAGGEAVVTFWEFVPTSAEPVSAAELGRLLRALHDLPAPPFDLPEFQPLRRLIAAARSSPWLRDDERVWLLSHADELRGALNATASSLGPPGMVHGDAQLGNTIRTCKGVVLLGDWDSLAGGAPGAWDLVFAEAERRFGGSPALLGEVLHAYGSDPTGAAGWPVLLDVFELRSVAAHIRRAPASEPHAAEARLRIAALRRGDRRVRWHAVG